MSPKMYLIKKRPLWYLQAPKRFRHKWTIPEQNKVYTLSQECSSTQEIIERMGPNYHHLTRTQVQNQIRIAKKAFKGLCYACGNPIPDNIKKPNHLFYLCKRCQNLRHIYKSLRRKKLLKNHICPYCEKKPLYKENNKEHYACIDCLSATYRRRLSMGICGICGKQPIDVNRSNALCTNCLDNQKIKKGQHEKMEESPTN